MNIPHWNRRDFMTLAAATSLTGGTWAQNAPKVIKIMVGFPPGQATDQVARELAERLRQQTQDNYLVDNRPGQGGSLALGLLAKAAPNGTTVMLAHMSALATNPHIYQSVPYDTLKDFEGAAMVGDLPFVLVCNPQMPFQNFAEFLQYARANPNKLTNASSGNGTVSHLAMEEIKRRAGLSITHVPYKGSVAGLTDVISGNVSMALETASAVRPHIESGRLRGLAVGSANRLSGVLSSLPTLIEQGFPDLKAVTWLMMLYPAGTPKAHLQSVHQSVNSIMKQPEVQARMLSIGLQPRLSSSVEETDEYLKTEYQFWADVVKRSGVPKE